MTMSHLIKSRTRTPPHLFSPKEPQSFTLPRRDVSSYTISRWDPWSFWWDVRSLPVSAFRELRIEGMEQSRERFFCVCVFLWESFVTFLEIKYRGKTLALSSDHPTSVLRPLIPVFTNESQNGLETGGEGGPGYRLPPVGPLPQTHLRRARSGPGGPAPPRGRRPTRREPVLRGAPAPRRVLPPGRPRPSSRPGPPGRPAGGGPTEAPPRRVDAGASPSQRARTGARRRETARP